MQLCLSHKAAYVHNNDLKTFIYILGAQMLILSVVILELLPFVVMWNPLPFQIELLDSIWHLLLY